jgi:hypothetical protein
MEDVERAAERAVQVRERRAEHARVGRALIEDRAVGGEDVDEIAAVLGQRPVARFARLQGLLGALMGGDVDEARNDLAHGPVGGEGRRGVDPDPALRAVEPRQAEHDTPRRPLGPRRRGRGARVRRQLRPVLPDNRPRERAEEPAARLLGRQPPNLSRGPVGSDDLAGRCRHHDAARHGVVEHAHLLRGEYSGYSGRAVGTHRALPHARRAPAVQVEVGGPEPGVPTQRAGGRRDVAAAHGAQERGLGYAQEPGRLSRGEQGLGRRLWHGKTALPRTVSLDAPFVVVTVVGILARRSNPPKVPVSAARRIRDIPY